MKIYLPAFLIFLLVQIQVFSQKVTISGNVYESGSKESLIGVSVYDPILKAGTVTNTYGFYSLTLPAGKHKILFSYVGYSTDSVLVDTAGSVIKDIFLKSSIDLAGVEITTTRFEKQSQDVQMGRISIPVQQIKSIPSFLGEKDVMKTIQLMPGVQKGHEGSTGIYVRGGGPDQNLIILDDAVVYNANHLFGFFSLFNGDALKSVELIKGGFPARYGGRLSSVIEMNMKDGSKEKYTGEAGIGLISSRAVIEGPIVKNKASFLLSGRRTYVDALVRPFMRVENGVFGYYFYDLNAKVNWDFGRKNKLYVSGYAGRDKFHLKQKDEYIINDQGDKVTNEMSAALTWQNTTGTMRWNHIFNDKLFSNTSLITTKYNLTIGTEEKYDNSNYSLSYISAIRDYSAKTDFLYYISPIHTLRYGAQSTWHIFNPSAIVFQSSADTMTNKAKTTNALENGIYIEDLIRTGNFQINPGLRLSHFNVESKNYFSLEPRLSASFAINETNSIKASFATMKQYIHLLSNTGVGLPTDLWVPATSKVKPQDSWQVSAGYNRDFTAQSLNFSAEVYYKRMNNIIGYKEGASFITVTDFETGKEMDWQQNITAGKGKSYGLELFLQRKQGKLTGWIGYTLSWTKHQFDELNNGKEFWAKYDRRHDLSFVFIYNPNKMLTLSAVWVYGTGEAITLPIGTYMSEYSFPYMGYYNQLTDYGERNGFRTGNYHRLDLGAQFHLDIGRFQHTFELAIYNTYSHKNPFFYYIGQDYSQMTYQSRTVLYKVALFPIIPTVTYSIKF